MKIGYELADEDKLVSAVPHTCDAQDAFLERIMERSISSTSGASG